MPTSGAVRVPNVTPVRATTYECGQRTAGWRLTGGCSGTDCAIGSGVPGRLPQASPTDPSARARHDGRADPSWRRSRRAGPTADPGTGPSSTRRVFQDDERCAGARNAQGRFGGVWRDEDWSVDGSYGRITRLRARRGCDRERGQEDCDGKGAGDVHWETPCFELPVNDPAVSGQVLRSRFAMPHSVTRILLTGSLVANRRRRDRARPSR